MTGDTPAPRRYRVGDLEVDADRVRVYRGESEIALPRLTFDLLVAIVEIAPAVATSDALLERVWPGVVVSPETVAQRVKLLRAALGDDPRAPRYVAVVRGRGYRLIPEVERVASRDVRHRDPDSRGDRVAEPGAARSAVAAAPELAVEMRRDTAWTHPRVLLATFALLALAAVAAWYVRDRPDRGHASVPPAARAPVTETTGVVAAPDAAGASDRATRREGTASALAPNEAEATDAAPPTQRSIAVLPFDSLSRDPEDAVYARGMAESVLHQLGTLRELEVIAPRSSFAFARGALDAREIGRRLGVRYLLEGSVQREGPRLRVTARLVNASTAAQVWSMRLERPHRDLFAVEDEIAAKVAEAFELSTASRGAARLKAQGTRSFDAYLEFLRARHRLASDRVADLDAAIAHLRRAVAIDATFAPAYVALAEAEVRRAEFAPSSSRLRAFAAARVSASRHVERALELDPNDGRAHLQRAFLQAFTDLAAAEAEYRRGLELAPNEADGYEGLATVVYEDPRRTDEALQLLERARRLDPLEPRYDVAKATLLAYSRADFAGAVALLRAVLVRHPGYAPAVARYGELLVACTGETAEAIRVLSRALAMDPAAESVRQQLVAAYLDVGDPASAATLVGDPARAPPGRLVELLVYREDWSAAARASYAAHAAHAVLPPTAKMTAIAVRMHAARTRDYVPARSLLESAAGVEWAPDGVPTLEEPAGVKEYGVNAAYVLLLAGGRAAATRLLRAVLQDIDFDATALRRGVAWSARSHAIALALLGEHEAAIGALRAIRGARLQHRSWYFLEREPAFEPLRASPAFAALVAESRTRRKAEQERLATLQASGEVPAAATLAPRDQPDAVGSRAGDTRRSR